MLTISALRTFTGTDDTLAQICHKNATRIRPFYVRLTKNHASVNRLPLPLPQAKCPANVLFTREILRGDRTTGTKLVYH